MDWTEVYKHIDMIHASGTIIGAYFDYYLTLVVKFYDYERGFVNHVRINRGGVFSYWQ